MQLFNRTGYNKKQSLIPLWQRRSCERCEALVCAVLIVRGELDGYVTREGEGEGEAPQNGDADDALILSEARDYWYTLTLTINGTIINNTLSYYFSKKLVQTIGL